MATNYNSQLWFTEPRPGRFILPPPARRTFRLLTALVLQFRIPLKKMGVFHARTFFSADRLGMTTIIMTMMIDHHHAHAGGISVAGNTMARTNNIDAGDHPAIFNRALKRTQDGAVPALSSGAVIRLLRQAVSPEPTTPGKEMPRYRDQEGSKSVSATSRPCHEILQRQAPASGLMQQLNTLEHFRPVITPSPPRTYNSDAARSRFCLSQRCGACSRENAGFRCTTQNQWRTASRVSAKA